MTRWMTIQNVMGDRDVDINHNCVAFIDINQSVLVEQRLVMPVKCKSIFTFSS